MKRLRAARRATIPRALRLGATRLVVIGALAGCASEPPAALPEQPRLAPDIARLSVDTDTLRTLPDVRLSTHRFDPSDGLDITEVAMLAVATNPELRALRAQAGVTRAQAFAAGLLPDPQLALSTEHVLGGPAGAGLAFSAGLALDVGAWLARSSARAAAEAEVRKSDLELLWQEWQTVAQARLAFVRLDALAQSQALLAHQRSLAQARLAQARGALEAGLITRDTWAPALLAFEDATRQDNELDRQRNQARHDLNALLGLAPELVLTLSGPAEVETLDESQVQAALALAPRRRPDLLALQAGFEAQDDRLRGALRARFPAITLGPTRARDTSHVDTAGLSLNLALPLFNRNRGNIAIEAATREKLRLDYQQRLDATAIDAHRLLAEQALLRRQAAALDATLPALAQAAAQAADAHAAHRIDAFALAATEGAWLARRLERVALGQALQEQAIALQALVGPPSNRIENPS